LLPSCVRVREPQPSIDLNGEQAVTPQPIVQRSIEAMNSRPR